MTYASAVLMPLRAEVEEPLVPVLPEIVLGVLALAVVLLVVVVLVRYLRR